LTGTCILTPLKGGGFLKQPLEDVQILDLTRVFAGPAGSMILGDLGADVIRVEAPGGSDSIRGWSPFVDDQSTYYFTANRNKRSITINLKNKEGKALFKKLVEKADVVMENFKTGTMDRLGLGYEDLKKVNPKIIMCSITGYGQTGPLNKEPGFDPVIQAVGGLMDVTGHPDGEPTRVGIPVVDILSSLYTAISILSALRVRDDSGEGQQIDISLLDVQVSSLANIASSYLNTGYISKRMGNNHNNIVPYQVFQCKDKPIMIAAGSESQFKSLCEVVGHREWISDERFKTNAVRVENRKTMTEKLQAILETRTADDWLVLLSEKGIPAGAVNNVEEVFKHPQVIARKLVEKVSHPTLGEISLIRNPLIFSKTPINIRKHPPVLGEHTETFLNEALGLTQSELDRLHDQGAI
jgi:crotonobetainyl-CoA:carnitine CoA-transferase CaiB-like acyl-CoA transferase